MSLERSALGRLLAGCIAVFPAVVLVAAIAMLAFPSGATVATADFGAEDVHVTTEDGRVDSVSVDPTITVTWQGFDAPVETVNVSLASRFEDSQWRMFYAEDHPASGTSGTETYALGEHQALGLVYPSDGAGQQFDVGLRLTVTAESATGRTATTTDTATFSVTVENADAEVSVSGAANPSAE